jgi:hypothetical protein
LKNLLTYVFVSWLAITSVNAQVLKYDVMKGSKNLGLMTVKRTINGSVEEIKIESEVTYKILFSFTVKYNMYEKFTRGDLNWGKALSTLNGRTQKDSKIVKAKTGYDLTLDGVTANLESDIEYSISQIYFEEPSDGQEVFSQQFAQYLSFKKVGKNKYLLSSPDGDNYYTYTNGICTEVRVLRDFANFSFVMQPQSIKGVQLRADSLYVEAN